jgi:hypothetical protein
MEVVKIRSMKMVKELYAPVWLRGQRIWRAQNALVMAGLVPAIHVLTKDEERRGCPGQARGMTQLADASR